MSEQLPIKVAPSPAPKSNKTPTTALKSDVSADNKSEFGGVLSNQVQSQGPAETPPAAKGTAPGNKTTSVQAEDSLPQDGKVLPLPVSPELLEPATSEAEGDVELATTAGLELTDEITLDAELVPEGEEGTALAAPVIAVDSKLVEATRLKTGAEKPATPTTPASPAETLARLTPTTPTIAGEAADDTAQAQAARLLHEAEAQEGSIISLASRSEVEKSPLQANRIIEQFTDVSARQASTTNPSTPVSAVNPVNTASSTTTSATGLQQVSIDVPVQHQQWQRAFAERVVWSVGNNQSVQVRVNPAELGPIDIQVNVTKEQTNITFNTTHAMTRDTIESALPRLREMLANEGLNLGDVDVRHQDSSAREQAADNDQGGGAERHAGLGQHEQLAEDQSEVMLHPVMVSERAVDYYI